MLANNEIQALITAIGTGVRDEFDLERRPLPQDHPDDRRRRRRRPHPHAGAHLPLPRDAGADRRRLRLHRQAAALQGQAAASRRSTSRRSPSSRSCCCATSSRSSSSSTRDGKQFKLTDEPLAALQPPLKEYEGWVGVAAGRVRPRASIDFLEESQILDEGVADARRRRRSCSRPTTRRASRTTTELRRADRRRADRSRRSNRAAGLARTHRLPAALFESHRVPQLVEVHAELLKLVGRPPFTVDARRARRDEARLVRGAAPRGARARAPGRSCSASRASAR